jgi:hypothetical protein
MSSILFFVLLIAVFGGTFIIHYLSGDKSDKAGKTDKTASEIAASKEEK